MEREKRAKSAKASAREAQRSAIRARKSGLGGVSRTSEFSLADEGDVYDVVDEAGYASLVSGRREREDFVVDDDGLGYHDDGEEHFGDDAPGGEGKDRKRSRKGTGALDDAQLKKARAHNALTARQEQEEQKADGSLWGFVSKGKQGDGISQAVAQRKVNLSDSLDDMLAVGGRPGARAKGKARPAAAARARPAAGAARKRPGAAARARPAAPSSAPAPDDDADDNFTDAMDDDDADAAPALGGGEGGEAVDKRLSFTGDGGEGAAAAPAAPARARSRFAKAVKVEVSAAVSGTIQSLSRTTEAAAALPGAPGLKKAAGGGEQVGDVGVADVVSAGAHASFQSVVKDVDGKQVLDMFWLDAYEKRGVVYLFGKVEAELGNPAAGFVSCCVVVSGNERNM
ncbi:hypothetical protein TeGR_g5479 [Tetraparma gracilis]|uniref:DNA polymerase alpha catalytic subunit N-terminal domain-containing protein n=1 Tax=Tetraparma gracilis TaxID=2962635 RepID=A0ABQ6MJ15_9STRA|nr:hypothetical protein TeGR_g5479 [Tetraparma gracilis]